MNNHKIESGDTVKHFPSGEDWFLLGVDTTRNLVCAAGWPPSMGYVSDCTLVEKGSGISEQERKYRDTRFCGYWDDEREVVK